MSQSPHDPPLPEAAVRLVQRSRTMARVLAGVVLLALCVLVLAAVATARHVEAAVAACAVGWLLLVMTAVRRRKA